MNTQTIKLCSSTPGIKILGERYLESEEQLNIDWTASGIEFVAECGGDVIFSAASFPAEKTCRFRAFVDGEPWKGEDGSVYYTVRGESEVVLAGIPSGEHLIRLVKVNGYTLGNITLYSMTLNGRIVEEKKPADKRLYVEFIGDSITCGWGTVEKPDKTYDGTSESQDATLAFAYRTAAALDADYAMTALSGQGIIYGRPIPQSSRYASYARSTDKEYGFPRRADLVVMTVGTNDKAHANSDNITPEAFRAVFVEFAQYIRKMNGDCRILAAYNLMGNFISEVEAAIEELGGAEKGFYTICVKKHPGPATNANGGKGHPDKYAHAFYAEQVTEKIREILGI